MLLGSLKEAHSPGGGEGQGTMCEMQSRGGIFMAEGSRAIGTEHLRVASPSPG